MYRQIKNFMDAHIDYQAAVAAALVLGAIVFWINYDHGLTPALTAAAKQMTYTFFVAGLITRNNAKLAVKFDTALFAIPVAVIISSSLAIGLTYIVHSVKGTPEPLMSTLPTMLIGPPGFAILAWHARRSALKESANVG